MPDLVTTANQLKGVPDQWLQHELAAPSGAVPSYLVLAEAQRRATLRSGGAQSKQQQASSVYDDVLRNLTSGAPPAGPPAPPGMASPPSGLGQLAQGGPPPPQNFKPPQAMATGGSVDDSDDTLPSYAKPGPYQTLLTPRDEDSFQSWVKKNKVPFEDSPQADYDMRGFYQAMQAGKAKQAQNLHFPDTWKTPYHKTFSNESMYATPDAPRWKGNRLVDKSGRLIVDETPIKKADGGSLDDSGDDSEEDYLPPSTGSASRGADPSQYDKYIQDSGERHGVDPDLVRAVMKTESNFKRGAVSGKGATGLMQLMPGTARDMGVKDRKDPQQAIEGGTRYLKWLSEHLNTDDPDLILAGYNAGPGAVQKYGGVPPYKETKNYINLVKGTLYQLKNQQTARQAEIERLQGPQAPTVAQTAPDVAAPDESGSVPDESGMPPQLESASASAPDTSAASAPSTAPSTAVAPPVTPPATPAAEDLDPYSDKNITRQRKLFERLYGSKAEPGADLKAEIARIRSESARLAKPSGWQMLADFGWGMAASPAHSLFTQIGAGGQAMSKAQQERFEQARKMQLDLLGVDVKLDDQARDAQGKIAQLTGQAVNQAAQKQIADFEALARSPGAKRGNANESPGANYRFEPNPQGGRGVWLLPTTSTVTAEMLPFVKGTVNPATGKKYQVGEAIPQAKADKIEDEMRRVAGREANVKPTATSTRNASAVDQFYSKHPELTRPVGADGNPKDPSAYVLTDVPPEYQAEASYYGQLLTGMTKAKAEDLIARGTPEQKQLGQKFLDIHSKQVGAEATSRSKATTEAMASELTPGALDLYSEQYINGKFTSRNPAIMAAVGNAAAEKLKARGMTTQAAMIQRNAAEANKSALNELTKVNAAANAYSDTAVSAMTNLDAAAREVADLGVPFLNTPLRDLSSKFAGNPKVAAFRAALTPVQTDIARILSSPRLTGVLTDNAREEMKPALGEGATYQQLLAAMNVFYKDMEGRKVAYEKEMGLLQQMSVVGQAITPKAGETPAAGGATAPAGKKVATRERIQQAADQFFGGDYAAAAKSFTDKGYEIQ